MVGTSTELQSARLWHLYLDLCICNACKRYNACLTIIVSVFQVGQPWLRILPKPLLILRQSLSSYYSTTLNSNDFIFLIFPTIQLCIVQIENSYILNSWLIIRKRSYNFRISNGKKIAINAACLDNAAKRNRYLLHAEKEKEREGGEERDKYSQSDDIW